MKNGGLVGSRHQREEQFVSHDVTGTVATPPPARANRQTRRRMRFVPSALLAGAAGIVAPLALATSPASAAAPTVSGYTLVTNAGGVFNFGSAPNAGGAIGLATAPVVGIAPTSTGKGYWVATATAACSPSATPSSTARSAPRPSRLPWWPSCRPPRARVLPRHLQRRRVHLRRCAVLRLGGQPEPRLPDRGYLVTSTVRGTTWSAPTAACSPSVTLSSPASCRRPSAGPLPTAPRSASPPTRRARAT